MTIAALAVLLAVGELALTAHAASVMWHRFFGLWDMTPIALAFGLVVIAGAALAAAVSREALLRYATCTVAVATVWIALEVAGLAGIVSWPALLARPGSEIGTRRTPYLDVSGVTKPDIAERWGLQSRPVEFRYHTDRHGFRSAVDRESAEIYLVGDSMLVAALLPYEQTLAARLEAEIGRPVMNVALIGIGPQEEAELFRESGLDAAGALVVQVIFEGNDLRDSKVWRERLAGTPPALPREQQTLTFQLLRRLRRLTQSVPSGVTDRACEIDGVPYYIFWGAASRAQREDDPAQVTTAIEALRDDVEKGGGAFAVVFVPSKLRSLGPLCAWKDDRVLAPSAANPTPLRDALLAWSERSGVPVLDLTAPLVESARGGHIPWFADDTHWNAEGVAVAARAMRDWDALRAVRDGDSTRR